MTKKKLIPYVKRLSGDIETPITLYSKYVGDKVGFLLETSDLEKGRYSFIGKGNGCFIKGNSDETIISDNKKKIKRKGKILDNAREYLKRYEINNTMELPFVGGLVGAMAYDIIRQYEKIPDTNNDFIDIPDAEFFIVTEFIMYDHFYNQIVLVVLEEDNKQGQSLAQDKLSQMEVEINKDDVSFEKLEKSNEENEVKATSNVTKEEFIKMVERAKEYIVEGDIFQVVLSQRWKVDIHEESFNLYRKLRSVNPSPYLFYFNFDGYQVVGSSPEMLAKMDGDKIYTCPIAGTRKRGRNNKEDEILAKDLLNDEKERAEHVMLVDLARNDIGKVSKVGTVKLNEFMKVKNYSHVMHLVSLVEGTVSNFDAFDVLGSVLPAGTLSGAPKIRAMEIIEELEKEKRGLYGGAVGYFSFDGNMDTCITIRTMIIKDKQAYLQAGAGIVADSIPAKEYEETENKVKALIKVLGRS